MDGRARMTTHNWTTQPKRNPDHRTLTGAFHRKSVTRSKIPSLWKDALTEAILPTSDSGLGVSVWDPGVDTNTTEEEVEV
ncbi:hypothetical protein E2C01_029212 [Portunus trituberculatus]|uniref:Uncharacterized protein n=1 Tax=Portunus trituberculatus TaxID=210409 RepID=A0A5B7ER92_PORTR|nr:hypothetical protein [Portunus trituberculatus]